MEEEMEEIKSEYEEENKAIEESEEVQDKGVFIIDLTASRSGLG